MNDFVELRQILAILLRRWWILLAGTLLAAVLGYWISSVQTPVYAASTTIYVGRSIQSSDLERIDLQLGAQLAFTYADLVRRKPVLQGTVTALQLDNSWQNLRDRVTVSPIENTQLLEIRVTAGSAEEAQMTADEIARQLIQIGPMSSLNDKASETRQFAEKRLSQMQANIEAAQRKLDELEARMATLVAISIDDVPALQAEANTLEMLIADWDNTYAGLLSYLNAEPATNHLAIVETAEASRTPIRPRVRLNTLLAGMIGLFLSMGLVFALEYFDETIKPTDAVTDILDLATLGSISRIKGKTIQEKLIVRQDLFSPASEDYRLLRNKIQVMCADWPRKVIMVTSPAPGEMKSITVANMGIVLAQAGNRVIIVDADLRQPMQHTLFQFPNHRGLTDLLSDPNLELTGELEKTAVPNLRVLSVGGLLPPHPSELLGSERIGKLLDRLAEQADIVLCDSAYAVAIADALVLSSHVDGVVLVVEIGKTRRSTAEQAVYNLRQVGANLMGSVLSPLPADRVATTNLKTSVAPGQESRRRSHANGASGPKDLPAPSPVPTGSATPELIERILALSLANPNWDSIQLSNQLKQEGATLSSSAIQNVLTKHGMGNRDERLMILEDQATQDGIKLSAEQIALIEKANPCFRERHLKSESPGSLLVQDTYYVGVLNALGRVYLHMVIDTYGSYAFGILHASKQPEAAVALLQNDVLPFYQTRSLPVKAILTDSGREFGGKENHPYELCLERNGIEHRRAQAHLPQANGFIEYLGRTVLDEFFRVAFRNTVYESLDGLQADFDAWLRYYNEERPHLGYPNQGSRPLDMIIDYLTSVRQDTKEIT